MRSLVACAVLGTLVAPRLASAQPSQTAPVVEPAPAASAEIYSESTALALSLGLTAAGVGAMVAAGDSNNDTLASVGALVTFLGPSAGHIYTGTFFTRGLGLRAGGVAAVFTGALIAFADCPIFSEAPCEESLAGPTVAVLGAIAYVVGTADDIITAPRRAARLNREARARITLAPSVTPDRVGLAVVGQF